MEAYPKWLFSKDGKAELVKDAAAEAALGKGYSENPEGRVEVPVDPNAPAAMPVPKAHAHVDYPMWVFHKTEKPKLVHSADEFHALGKGWYDSPECKDPAPAVVAPPAPPKPVANGKKAEAAKTEAPAPAVVK